MAKKTAKKRTVKKPQATDTPVIFVCGRRRSGKSSWVKEYIYMRRRLLVWDYTGEYAREISDIVPVTGRESLLRALKSTKGAGRFAFNGSRKEFDFFCRCALAWGRCCLVVEELASLTGAGKAADNWGDVVRLSGHKHLEIVGIAQRMAEIDKTIVGNVSRIIVFPMGRNADRVSMDLELDVGIDKLAALKTGHYIEKDTATGKVLFKSMDWVGK